MVIFIKMWRKGYPFNSIRNVFLCAVAALATSFAQAPTEVYNGNEVIARQILVKLPVASPAVVQAIARLVDAQVSRPIGGGNVYLFESKSLNVPAMLSLLRGQPITYAEPNQVLRKTRIPNDPSFPSLWAMQNTAMPGADIGATGAWDVFTGSTANVIGVVDTGVDYTHPDLAANIWVAPAAFTVTIGGVQITCPAGSHGFNAITNTCDPADDNSHGSHVSGTIGAVGNNGIGVVGVNWSARIMGLKFLDSTGTGSVANAIDAIEFALQVKSIFAGTATPVNVRVLSNSYGGGGFSQSFLDEINKAGTNDVLFVAAAGNAAANNDTAPFYPANYGTSAANV